MKNLVILGGSGCLGFEVTRLLKKSKEFNVISISNTKNKIKFDGHTYRFKKIDLLKKNNIKKILELEPSIIINCLRSRSKIKSEFNYINYELIKEITKKCKLETMISISSGIIYDDSKKKINENSKIRVLDNYSRIKLKLDHYLLKQLTKFRVIIIRPFSFFGVMANENEIFSKIIKNYESNYYTALTKGDHYRDFCSATFIAKFIKFSVKVSSTRGIYNIGNGKRIKFRSIVDGVFSKLSINPILNYGHVDYKPNEKKNLICSLSGLSKTNFKDKRVSLAYSVYEYIRYKHTELKVNRPNKYEKD